MNARQSIRTGDRAPFVCARDVLNAQPCCLRCQKPRETFSRLSLAALAVTTFTGAALWCARWLANLSN